MYEVGVNLFRKYAPKCSMHELRSMINGPETSKTLWKEVTGSRESCAIVVQTVGG